MTFTMPEIPGGRSNEPMDLGTLTAELFDALKAGEPARIRRRADRRRGPGGRLKLSAYRGKLVLLNFWRPWNQQDDMMMLKEVQATFGRDPRFVLISLAFAKDARQAEEVIKEKGLTWTHGLVGDLPGGVYRRYKIREMPNVTIPGPDKKRRRVPLTFLIGPDWRILAHDLIGRDLEAVRKALEILSSSPRRPGNPSRLPDDPVFRMRSRI